MKTTIRELTARQYITAIERVLTLELLTDAEEQAATAQIEDPVERVLTRLGASPQARALDRINSDRGDGGSR